MSEPAARLPMTGRRRARTLCLCLVLVAGALSLFARRNPGASGRHRRRLRQPAHLRRGRLPSCRPASNWETNDERPAHRLDPRRLRGGTLQRMRWARYPLTFRLMGPNSNDAFAGWNRPSR